MFFGGIRDPILISQLDQLATTVEDTLRVVLPYDFELALHTYGKDSILVGSNLPSTSDGQVTEVGILVKVLAPTQEQADAIANLAKVFFTHAPYPGQVATAGNFIMPFSPCDLSLGPAAEFCLYHLMQVDEAAELFPFTARTIGGPGANEMARPILQR
jgi:hypothetical protein